MIAELGETKPYTQEDMRNIGDRRADEVRRTSRFFCRLSFFSFLLLLSIVLAHQPILNGIARILAPLTAERAEVLILEGTQQVKVSAMKECAKLLNDGKADRLVVVVHEPEIEGRAIKVRKTYAQSIVNDLEQLGLDKERIQVISVPISGHPITLAEARMVTGVLSEHGVRKAILVSEGFHCRRSFGVYNQEGKGWGLHIAPYSHFSEYDRDSWWRSAKGIGDFLKESLKLSYYLLHGYVSISALWNSAQTCKKALQGEPQ